ncbi:hypothetical protein [Aurantiacibacter gilvus]|uniref:Uncharacterized protein n=1 Tax=Aurantiacibacter gilvus TaxID=3139141 RepID=A0ABU9IIA6_9SPHN
MAALFAVGWRNTGRMIRTTKDRRPNPTEAEYLGLMRSDVSDEAAKFLWDTASRDLGPQLTLHPDDHLTEDLPLDPDNVRLDWPREFAKLHGFDEAQQPDWPEDWPLTVRKYGQWLDLGLRAGQS